MILPDVNVLIYAHREDAPEHDRYAGWLRSLVEGPEPFAVSSPTLAGFLRIVTHRRIFQPVTPRAVALDFCRRLVEHPSAVFLRPGPSHWDLLSKLIEDSAIQGALVSDAVLAALALEHGAELASTDSDFARFPDLRWRHPLAP